MGIRIFFICLLSLASGITQAQQSGNSVYGQGYNSSKGKYPSKETLYLSDSTFIIEASVIQNVVADGYVAIFGLAEEGSTLKECNEKIDKRIRAFTIDLKKMCVAPDDFFIDMTSQNKTYDYKIKFKFAEEYLQGFELKKNVIVKFKDIGELNQMVIAASNYEILILSTWIISSKI